MLKKRTKKAIRTAGIILFCFYIILLAYLLFFSEAYGRVPELVEIYHYNLIPFVEMRRFWLYRDQLGFQAVFANLVGNVIGFIPFGFILPVIAGWMRSGWLITVSGFTLSFVVEVLQLITRVGSFDVDDLILNTLGTFLGYLLFAVCNEIRRRAHG